MKKNLVSIIMPAFNAQTYIAEAIESLQIQSYDKWELIVVDDGSVDDTTQVVNYYAKKDNRIKLKVNPGRKGVSSARNIGIDAAQGEYIGFLDADDYYYINSIEQRVRYLQQNVSASAVFCPTEYRDENSKLLYTLRGPKKVSFHHMHSCPFHGNSLLIKRSALNNIEFDESLANAEDWLFFQRLARAGVIFHRVNGCQVVYRQHRNSTVSEDFEKQEEYVLKVISIVYGRDVNCKYPDPKFVSGLECPSYDSLIRKRRLWMMFRYLLMHNLDKAQKIAAERSPNDWSRLNMHDILYALRSAIVHQDRESIHDWQRNLPEHLQKITPFFKTTLPVPKFLKVFHKLNSRSTNLLKVEAAVSGLLSKAENLLCNFRQYSIR